MMHRPIGFRAMLSAALLTASLFAAPVGETPSLETMAGLMVGSFSSAAQAKADPEHFKDIRLGVARIWKARTDGIWLYVEQAAAESLDKPYRQRVYHLRSLGDGRFQSEIYSLKGNPLRLAGAWRQVAPLADLGPADLDTRTGCAVFLTPDGRGGFRGATHERDCESSLRGPSYAPTEVQPDPGGTTSWDRGYDAQGKQVWGATAGGYRFLRLR